jgi:hypothetical protein
MNPDTQPGDQFDANAASVPAGIRIFGLVYFLGSFSDLSFVSGPL